MKIWADDITLALLNELNRGTLGEFLEINFTELGADYLVAEMPVVPRVKQPFGLLHGGASVALAETIGSVASWCVVNRNLFMGVGIEINANHLKAVTGGRVKAVCRPIKTGGRLHVWEVKIHDEENDLCCVCRFTTMIVPLPKKAT